MRSSRTENSITHVSLSLKTTIVLLNEVQDLWQTPPSASYLTTCDHLRYRSRMNSTRAKFHTGFGLCCLLVIVWLFSPTSPAGGNSETLLNDLARLGPAEREKKLIEGAKKEGGVVIYSSENVTLLQRYEA